VAKRAERPQLVQSAFTWMRDIHVAEELLTHRPSKRVLRIWERCRVCALQMVGGPRCMEHNAYPTDDRSIIRAAEASRR